MAVECSGVLPFTEINQREEIEDFEVGLRGDAIETTDLITHSNHGEVTRFELEGTLSIDGLRRLYRTIEL